MVNVQAIAMVRIPMWQAYSTLVFTLFYMDSWPGDDKNRGATSGMTPVKDSFAAIVYFRYIFSLPCQ
ncbi:MAG: hypothetical protein FGF52_00925 [Candidatus Brockarchaeota archaeon]|nr:hypothetical protein [Candidatus Brockarchaeota archaeon]